MKKIFFVLLISILFVSCATKIKPTPSEPIIEAKVENAITLEQLKSLEKDSERQAAILEKVDNKIAYGFDLLDELSISIAFEKQQAYNEGYEAGKKDAQLATEGYIKIEDVIALLREQGLLKEE